MGGKTGLLEKENAVLAAENGELGHSNLRQTIGIIAKQPEADGFLENTLFNVKIEKSLTKREVEILKLIVSGITNKKIAQKIYRTERTVEYHRNRLMRKLNAHSAADLIKCAITMRIV